MKSVKIGNKTVGEDHPCYIIAEAGANHNRDLGMAKELIDVAAESGADAVKFQTYTAEKLYSKHTPKFKYLEKITDKSTWDLIKEIELPREWQPKLASYAAEKGIDFMSTPFDKEAVDELDEVGVPAFKIASFEIVDLPLVEYAASKGKPMIISTGMADYTDIEDAIKACLRVGNDNIILLQCVSLYPAPPKLCNLKSMATMKQAFGVPVGFSDHTEGISISIAARALGADIIEKHFTLDRTLPGPDHPFAIEPDELTEMIRGIRSVDVAVGNGIKNGPAEEERESFKFGRRSLVAARQIKAGQIITRDAIVVKRPGWGILPKYLGYVVGRRAMTEIREDEVLTWNSLE